MTIDLLPNELLLHIFNYLDYSSKIQSFKVCRRWRSLAQDPSLDMFFCKDICRQLLSFPQQRITPSLTPYIFKCHLFEVIENLEVEPIFYLQSCRQESLANSETLYKITRIGVTLILIKEDLRSNRKTKIIEAIAVVNQHLSSLEDKSL